MRSTIRQPGWLLPALLALTLAGALAALYVTRSGPGLTDDSYFYIQPGQAWLAGEPFRPSALFAPLLTYLLAGLGRLGISAMQAARLINALSFGAAVLIAGLAVRRTGAAPGFAVLASALVLTAEQLVAVSAWAMSEPLYLALSLLALVSLDGYLRSGRPAAFWAAVGATALAGLTRYVGAALVGAGVLSLLLWPGRAAARRWRDALVYGLLAILPIGLVVFSNRVSTGEPFGHRAFTLGLYRPEYTRGLLNALLSWFLPGRLINGREFLIGGIVLLVTAGTAAWYFWQVRSQRAQAAGSGDAARPALLLALGLFVAMNGLLLGLLLFTTGIIAPGESYSARYLAPVLLAVLILFTTGLDRLWRAARQVERLALLAAVAGLLFISLYRAQDTARALAQTSGGYNTPRWHISETVRYLNLHPDVPVVSTANYGLYFWTGSLPRSIGEFPSVEALHAHLRESGAFLVLVDSMPPEVYGFNSAALVDGLVLHQRFSEGSIYTAD